MHVGHNSVDYIVNVNVCGHMCAGFQARTEAYEKGLCSYMYLG